MCLLLVRTRKNIRNSTVSAWKRREIVIYSTSFNVLQAKRKKRKKSFPKLNKYWQSLWPFDDDAEALELSSLWIFIHSDTAKGVLLTSLTFFLQALKYLLTFPFFFILSTSSNFHSFYALFPDVYANKVELKMSLRIFVFVMYYWLFIFKLQYLNWIIFFIFFFISSFI